MTKTNSGISPEAGFEPMPFLFSTRLASAYVLQFFYIGLYLPFFPVWLAASGFSAIEISSILTMPLIIRIVATLPAMWLADHHPDRARLHSVFSVLAAISIGFLITADGFWAVMAVTLVFNVFYNPLMPLLDAITLSGVRRFDANYGRIRTWGSVAFILANLGGGVVLASFAAPAILWSLIACMVASAAFSFAVPRIGRSAQPVRRFAGLESLISVFADRRFMAIAVAIGLGQAAHSLLYGFGTIYWQSIGFGAFGIGALWAIGVIAEIALFQVAKGLLGRFGPLWMIALGLVAGALRWALFPLISDYTLFLGLQILHGLSFGAVHVGSMHFIMQSVSDDRLGAGQGGVYVVSGVFMALGIFFSGPLYEAFGTNGFWVMSGVCFIALIVLWIAAQTGRRRGAIDS